jgi:hypothetical protein
MKYTNTLNFKLTASKALYGPIATQLTSGPKLEIVRKSPKLQATLN